MNILVSACLAGENCKYNGKNNLSNKLMNILEGHKIIKVCPEVLGGLPVPRTPAEISCADRVVRTQDGSSVDAEFRRGAADALQCALAEGVDLAILQSRSPSCGVGTIYDGTFSKTKIKGNGIFAEMLINSGIRTVDIEEFLLHTDLFIV